MVANTAEPDIKTLPSTSSATASVNAEMPPAKHTHNHRPTSSFIKRDAETYGIKYKPERMYGFWNPQQVKEKHLMWLKLLGRVGWGAKATIYALIGGLACDNAVGNIDSSASPQGAFVLIGTANGGRGALVVLAIATATYSAWRFWEGIVGQGYDDNFGKWKNFFKFRLSPFVSGGVYVAYDVLIITTIPRDDDEERDYLRNSTWPNNWRHSNFGKAALVIVGLAFVAATIVQLEQFLTKSFHNTIKTKFHYMPPKYHKAFRIFVLTTGHLGVLGRAGIFAFAAVLFFRTIREETSRGKSAFGDALAQLQTTKAGRAALFIMGFLVVTYGLFAVLNMYARFFPTPPPTGYKKQHRPVNDLLPQYGGGETGFNPMGAARNSLETQPNGIPTQKSGAMPTQKSGTMSTQKSGPHHHSFLSPMHNALEAQQSNAQNSVVGHPTGYPSQNGVNGNAIHPQPQVTISQIPEKSENNV